MESPKKDRRHRVAIADGGSPNKHTLAELAAQIENLKAQQQAEFDRLYRFGEETAWALLGQKGPS